MNRIKQVLLKWPRIFAVSRRVLYLWRAVKGRAVALASSRRQWRIYRNGNPILKLHVGCGDNLLHGWLNTDAYPRQRGVYFSDATRPLPFPTNTFSYVFSEHVIEHILFLQSRKMLAEWFRVLKPGGRCRISTPDLDRIIRLKSSDLRPLERDYVAYALSRIPGALQGKPSFVVNSMMRDWGHLFLFDMDTLASLLESCGFTSVTAFSPGESDNLELNDLERHGDTFPVADYNLVESMVLEGSKPISVAAAAS